MKSLSCLGLLVAVGGFCACSFALGLVGCFTADQLGYLDTTARRPAPLVLPTLPNIQPTPAPAPVPVCPGPDCPDQPDPKRPRRPWGPRGKESVDSLVCGSRDGSIHDGHCVQVDLPVDQLVRNTGGSDGSGLCVFTSIMFSARLQNVPQLKDFQAWMKRRPGGGWPQKVDQMIRQKCREANVPVPDYLQIENGDWELVKLALKTGRMPAITYGTAHMTNIVCLDGKYGAFRDNNFIGEREIDWMTESQAKAKAGGNRFWAVILLAPRPPMPPKNSSKAAACSAPYAPGRYEWRRLWELPAQWSLWRDGVQVGGYDAEEDLYGVRKGQDNWGPWYRRPPVDLPPDALAALGANAPGGMLWQYEGKPRYSRNGAVIGRAEALGAIAGPQLVDDSAKLSLTVIGEQKDIDRVRAELVSPANTAFAAHVVFQGYLPNEWSVDTNRFGFAHDGKPTIYLQKPDGTVLLHLQTHDATTFGRLRQKDPNYNPSADPGMPNPSLPGGGDPLATFALLAAAALAAILSSTGIGVSGGFALHFLHELEW